MPDLKFQGQDVGKLAKSINIVGVGNVSVDDDGNVTIRLGENLNSSSFNTKDSNETNGTASASYTTTGSRTLADGTSANVWLLGTNKITINTAGKIHFDDDTTTFVLVVGGKTFTFGPITKSTTYKDAAQTGAQLVVSNWGAEAKSATGATGYSANVSFTINVESLGLTTDGYVDLSLKHMKAGAIVGKEYAISNMFYLVNDTTTKANATSATVSLSATTSNVKTLSGVSYLTGGTVTYTATVDHVGVPATNGATTSPVTFDNSGWAADKTADVAYNATTASATASLVTGQYASTATTVAVSAKNVNGTGTTTSASLGKALLVDTATATASTDTIEYFDTEAKRLQSDMSTAWVSTTSLAAASGEGATGLMIKGGQLKYPAGTFTGCNDGFGGIVGANQPDYSGCTGERFYARKFVKTGSIPSATFTLTHTASIATFIDAASTAATKMWVEVSKNGTVWYDINTAGIGTARNLGTTSSSFTFEFTDGVATGGMFFRIRMASKSVTAVINQVTMA